jgi:hypothetical protein
VRDLIARAAFVPSLTGLGILSFPFPGTPVPGYRLFRPYGTRAGWKLRLKRLMRLKGLISSLLHAGSAKLQQIADNIQQGRVPRQERPPV